MARRAQRLISLGLWPGMFSQVPEQMAKTGKSAAQNTFQSALNNVQQPELPQDRRGEVSSGLAPSSISGSVRAFTGGRWAGTGTARIRTFITTTDFPLSSTDYAPGITLQRLFHLKLSQDDAAGIVIIPTSRIRNGGTGVGWFA